MTTQQFSSLEGTLLKNLSLATQGDQAAKDRVFDNLKQLDPDRHADMLPTLRRVLALKDPEIQLAAAIFIGSLGQAAEPAVPDLVAIAQGPEHLRDACASSLARIPGERSAAALVELFESSTSGDVGRDHMLLECLKSRAEDVTDYLPRLEATAARFAGQQADAVKHYLDEIRYARRLDSNQSLADADFVPRVPLSPPGSVFVDPASHYEPYRIDLDDGPGLVHEGRLPFEVTPVAVESDLGFDADPGAEAEGQDDTPGFDEPESYDPEQPGLSEPDRPPRGEVGLRVFRTTRASPEHVVVFSADDGWYGAPPTRCIEQLATACVHMCGLDPARTVWVEHWTAGSGANNTAAEEQSVVSMTYDPDLKQFKDPSWRPLASLESYLRSVGAIE